MFPLVKRGIEKSRILQKQHICVYSLFFFLIAAACASSSVDLSGQDENAVLRHSSICSPFYRAKGQQTRSWWSKITVFGLLLSFYVSASLSFEQGRSQTKDFKDVHAEYATLVCFVWLGLTAVLVLVQS